MAPNLELVYFDMAGRGELTRLCLAYGQIAFDDKRISKEAFMSLKPTLPVGQVPVLKVGNVVYPQSHAIVRYAANLAGICPADPLEALAVDCVVETIRELYEKMVDIVVVEKDEAKKEEKKKTLAKELLPIRMKYIESAYKGKYLLGDKISLADLAIFDFFDSGIKSLRLPELPFTTSLMEHVKAEPGISAYFRTKA